MLGKSAYTNSKLAGFQFELNLAPRVNYSYTLAFTSAINDPVKVTWCKLTVLMEFFYYLVTA